MHRVVEIRAELLGGAGTAVEVVRYADLVSFTCLKAFAFDQRFERKDAHDLTYCIEYAEEGLDGAARMFLDALESGHGEVIRKCLSILHRSFWNGRRSRRVSQGRPGSGGAVRTGRGRRGRPARSPVAEAAGSQQRDRTTPGPDRSGGGMTPGAPGVVYRHRCKRRRRKSIASRRPDSGTAMRRASIEPAPSVSSDKSADRGAAVRIQAARAAVIWCLTRRE